MSADQLFSLLNLIAVSGWLLLAVSPRWPWLVGVAGRAFPALFALVYVAVIALNWRGSERKAQTRCWSQIGRRRSGAWRNSTVNRHG